MAAPGRYDKADGAGVILCKCDGVLDPAAPLFEEERDALARAYITEFGDPLDGDRSISVAAYSGRAVPGDVPTVRGHGGLADTQAPRPFGRSAQRAGSVSP